MRNTYLLLLLLLCYGSIAGQGHEPVFPNLEGDELLDAVADDYTPSQVLSFSNSRDSLFGQVYQRNDSLSCVYTGWTTYLPPNQDPTQAAFMDGEGINTEHTWPRAKGADADPARADMHHLHPTRVDVNGDRGNAPFGEISDPATERWYRDDQQQGNIPSNNIDEYSEAIVGQLFEPRESHKGNVARAMFYFYSIYRSEALAADPNFFAAQRSTLCQWHQQDPVDELEWERTWQIADYQGTPNPFVLDCTLAGRMYCPEQTSSDCVSSTGGPSVDPGPIRIGGAQPNPSHGFVRIPYELSSSGRLTISWYDIAGRQYRTRSASLPPGQYEITTIPEHPGTWWCAFWFDDGGRIYRQTVRVVVLP